MRRHRVLVVDDSPTMRMLIAQALGNDEALEIVGEAGSALEAREAIKALDPDVVTLDVEMPGMPGIEFLDKLMRLRPMPVVMVSSRTGPGMQAAIDAMAIGAFDCLPKPVHARDGVLDRLAEVVKLAAASRSGLASLAARRAARGEGAARVSPAAPVKAPRIARPQAVAIGASTGGIEALSTLLEGWPADAPPTLVVQHLPAGFSRGFAQRLDRLSSARVREAENGMPLEPGTIYVAPGGHRHLMATGTGAGICTLVEADAVSGHRPSVDVLFHSVARRFAASSLAIVLTGMGSDGARGALEIRKAGGCTIGQDENSCLVYGMPKVAFQMGAIERQLPLESIANAVFGA